jgi:hypothetical protein
MQLKYFGVSILRKNGHIFEKNAYWGGGFMIDFHFIFPF